MTPRPVNLFYDDEQAWAVMSVKRGETRRAVYMSYEAAVRDRDKLDIDGWYVSDILPVAIVREPVTENQTTRLSFRRLRHCRRERAFLREWLRDFAKHLHQILGDEQGPDYGLTRRDQVVAAAVIQWLGTNVGMGFLEKVLGRLRGRAYAREVMWPNPNLDHFDYGNDAHVAQLGEELSEACAAGAVEKGVIASVVQRAYKAGQDSVMRPAPRVGVRRAISLGVVR